MALAACGGGGGGGGGSTPPTNPTGPSSGGLTQQSVQRTDVQSGVSGVQAVRTLAGGSSPLVRVRAVAALRAMVERRRETGTCSDNQIVTETPVSSTSVVLDVKTYYDAACAQIESDLSWTATQSGSTLTGPATETLYNTSDTVTETDTLQVTFYFTDATLSTPTGFSMLTTSELQGSTQLGEAGLACSFASTTSIPCGVASAVNLAAGGEIGVSINETATTGTATTVNMQIATYQANAANALTVTQATFPSFAIGRASDKTQSLNLTGSLNGTTLSLTVTDTTNGGTLTISGQAAGTVTGTLTNSSTNAQVASFTIDANGNGTVTFSDNTTATISNYSIQG